MLFGIIFFAALGAAAQPTFELGMDAEQMYDCGGNCPKSQTNLVCTELNGRYYVFPNKCYLDVMIKCYQGKFAHKETDPQNCNNFKGYRYIQFPSCADVMREANVQKSRDYKHYDVIIKKFDQFIRARKGNVSEDVAKMMDNYLNRMADILYKLETNITKQELLLLNWDTWCTACTEDTSVIYQQCLHFELQSTDSAIDYYLFVLPSVKYTPSDKIRLKNLINALLIIKIQHYFALKLNDLYKTYLSEFKIWQNYTVNNEVYSFGKTIIDIIQPVLSKFSRNCSVNEFKNVIYSTEGVTHPFDPIRFSNLQEFIGTFGYFHSLPEESAFERYEYAFTSAEIYLKELKATKDLNVAGFLRYRQILKNIGIALTNTSCYNQNILEYGLFSCLGRAWRMLGKEITVLRDRVSECFNNYKLNNYCVNPISKLPLDVRASERTLCSVLALKSPWLQVCCYK